MRRTDQGGVHELLDRLYQAATGETLWSQIVAGLKNAPWQPGSTVEKPSNGGTEGAAASNGRYLADSVTQFAYEAGQPARRGHWPPGMGRPPLDGAPETGGADEIPSGDARLARDIITGLRVPNIVERPDLSLLEAGAVPVARAGSSSAATSDSVFLRHTLLALQIARKLEEFRNRKEALEAGLDRLAVGLMVIHPDRRATPMNEEARAILAKRDLECRGGRLTTADKRARNQLDNLLAGLTDEGAGRPTGGGVTIRRMHGHALQLWGVPLRQEERALLGSNGQACGLIFVIDPDRAPFMPQHLLMEAFGLTRAETTLTLGLLYGETVDEYCDRTGISRNTARTHMRAIFDKLGVNKQTELIRLLSGFRLLNMGGAG